VRGRASRVGRGREEPRFDCTRSTRPDLGRSIDGSDKPLDAMAPQCSQNDLLSDDRLPQFSQSMSGY
jgi:hypothetical protein